MKASERDATKDDADDYWSANFSAFNLNRDFLTKLGAENPRYFRKPLAHL